MKPDTLSHFAQYPSLQGRSVFVTGGSSGIGGDIVIAFARQGAKVAFTGRNAEAAAGGRAWPRCRNWGRGSGRLARRRLFIEEGNVVETVTHAAQCSDSGSKGQ